MYNELIRWRNESGELASSRRSTTESPAISQRFALELAKTRNLKINYSEVRKKGARLLFATEYHRHLLGAEGKVDV
jgi:hypothetical protein